MADLSRSAEEDESPRTTERLFGGKIPTVDDAVFGHIKFTGGVWTHVPKDDHDFMVVVVAPASGPPDSQRAFFKKLCATLDDTVAIAKSFVQDTAADIDAPSLSLYSIEIGPEEEIARGVFTIELTDATQSPIHRVEFRDGKPSSYGRDD